jgi:methionine-rich copper-binding protein CopC
MTPVRWAACTALAFSAVALMAGPAAAHAELKTADPADGSTLAAAPAKLTMTFTEDLSATRSSATFAGKRLTTAQPTGHPDTLVADLGPIVASLHGPVAIVWRSVSTDDGHVATGTLHFQITAASPAKAAPATKAADTASAGSGLDSNALLYGGGLGLLCLAFGVVLFITVRKAQR